MTSCSYEDCAAPRKNHPITMNQAPLPKFPAMIEITPNAISPEEISRPPRLAQRVAVQGDESMSVRSDGVTARVASSTM